MENTTTKTRFFRDYDGWNGETTVELPNLGEGKQLVLSTSKSKYSGSITSTASVRTLERGMWTFCIAGKDGDYHKRVGGSEFGKRATERAVREQHERVLATLSDILANVTAHYAAQQQRKEEAEAQRLAA